MRRTAPGIDIRTAADAALAGLKDPEVLRKVERREQAAVVHLSRQTVRGLIAQRMAHGAAGAWLNREYPGGFPARRRPGLVWWGIRWTIRGLLSAARTRDRDAAVVAVFEPLEQISYELGRSLPNERRRRS